MLLTKAWLHECADTCEIRRHGNGFIQLILPDTRHLHIWNAALPPAQQVNTGIHDHRWSLQSTVLLGALRNHHFRLIPGNRWRVWEAVQGTPELQPQESLFDVEYLSYFDTRQGESYSFPALEFHYTETLSPLVVTLMSKSLPTPGHNARVLCPANQSPDNDYDWYYDIRLFRDVAHEAIASLESVP